MKPTFSNEQLSKDYLHATRYKTQISHFGADLAFKRKFSGYGPDAHHHGHTESKFYKRQLIETINYLD